MDIEARVCMERYLPKDVKIVLTPDSWEGDAEYKTIMMKTKDVIDTFLNLQAEALQSVQEEKDYLRRTNAFRKIKNMVYFNVRAR